MPGALHAKERLIPSSGWRRSTRRFGSGSARGVSSWRKRWSGGWRNWTAISDTRLHSRLPERRRKGTPAQRHVGLGGRVRAHALLLAIPLDRIAVLPSRTVLAAHRARGHLLGRGGDERAQHLHLFVADVLGLEPGGGLHGDQAEELEHVVLDDVAQRTRRVEVGAAAALHPDGLGDRDLHVLDVAAVEERLEDGVTEAERDQVLHRLLPEVVIDPVDLALVEEGSQRGVERARAREVAPEGLLDDHPRPGDGPRAMDEPRAGEPGDERREEMRRDRGVV